MKKFTKIFLFLSMLLITFNKEIFSQCIPIPAATQTLDADILTPGIQPIPCGTSSSIVLCQGTTVQFGVVANQTYTFTYGVSPTGAGTVGSSMTISGTGFPNTGMTLPPPTSVTLTATATGTATVSYAGPACTYVNTCANSASITINNVPAPSPTAPTVSGAPFVAATPPTVCITPGSGVLTAAQVPPLGVTAAAGQPAGTILNWFSAPSGGASLSTANPFTPTIAQINGGGPGTYTFYAETTPPGGRCPSVRTPVSFIVAGSPTGTLAVPGSNNVTVSVCQGDPLPILSALGNTCPTQLIPSSITPMSNTIAGALAAGDLLWNRNFTTGGAGGFLVDPTSFQVTVAGNYTFSLCGALGGAAGFDTWLGVTSYTGSFSPAPNPAVTIPGGINIANNDDFCGLQSQITVALTPNVNYLLLMSSFGAGTTGAYTITVTPPAGGAIGTPLFPTQNVTWWNQPTCGTQIGTSISGQNTFNPTGTTVATANNTVVPAPANQCTTFAAGGDLNPTAALNTSTPGVYYVWSQCPGSCSRQEHRIIVFPKPTVTLTTAPACAPVSITVTPTGPTLTPIVAAPGAAGVDQLFDYQYSLDGGAFTNTAGSTTHIFAGVAAGTHIVTVRSIYNPNTGLFSGSYVSPVAAPAIYSGSATPPAIGSAFANCSVTNTITIQPPSTAVNSSVTVCQGDNFPGLTGLGATCGPTPTVASLNVPLTPNAGVAFPLNLSAIGALAIGNFTVPTGSIPTGATIIGTQVQIPHATAWAGELAFNMTPPGGTALQQNITGAMGANDVGGALGNCPVTNLMTYQMGSTVLCGPLAPAMPIVNMPAAGTYNATAALPTIVQDGAGIEAVGNWAFSMADPVTGDVQNLCSAPTLTLFYTAPNSSLVSWYNTLTGGTPIATTPSGATTFDPTGALVNTAAAGTAATLTTVPFSTSMAPGTYTVFSECNPGCPRTAHTIIIRPKPVINEIVTCPTFNNVGCTNTPNPESGLITVPIPAGTVAADWQFSFTANGPLIGGCATAPVWGASNVSPGLNSGLYIVGMRTTGGGCEIFKPVRISEPVTNNIVVCEGDPGPYNVSALGVGPFTMSFPFSASAATPYISDNNVNVAQNTIALPQIQVPAGYTMTANLFHMGTTTAPSTIADNQINLAGVVTLANTSTSVAGTLTPLPTLTTAGGNNTPSGNVTISTIQGTNDQCIVDGTITCAQIQYTFTPAPNPTNVTWHSMATGGTQIGTTASGANFNAVGQLAQYDPDGTCALASPTAAVISPTMPGVYTIWAQHPSSYCRMPVTITVVPKPIITGVTLSATCDLADVTAVTVANANNFNPNTCLAQPTTIEYSLDGGAWGAAFPTAINSGCHQLKARYVRSVACAINGNPNVLCESKEWNFVVYPDLSDNATVATVAATACGNTNLLVADITLDAGITAELGANFQALYSINGGPWTLGADLNSSLTPGCHNLRVKAALLNNCGTGSDATDFNTVGAYPATQTSIASDACATLEYNFVIYPNFADNVDPIVINPLLACANPAGPIITDLDFVLLDVFAELNAPEFQPLYSIDGGAWASAATFAATYAAPLAAGCHNVKVKAGLLTNCGTGPDPTDINTLLDFDADNANAADDVCSTLEFNFVIYPDLSDNVVPVIVDQANISCVTPRLTVPNIIINDAAGELGVDFQALYSIDGGPWASAANFASIYNFDLATGCHALKIKAGLLNDCGTGFDATDINHLHDYDGDNNNAASDACASLEYNFVIYPNLADNVAPITSVGPLACDDGAAPILAIGDIVLGDATPEMGADFQPLYSIDGGAWASAASFAATYAAPLAAGCHTVKVKAGLLMNCGTGPDATDINLVDNFDLNPANAASDVCQSKEFKFIVYPDLSTVAPTVDFNTCGVGLQLDPLPVVVGFAAQYSFDNQTTWGDSLLTVTPGCKQIFARYVAHCDCGITVDGDPMPVACYSMELDQVVYPNLPTITKIDATCDDTGELELTFAEGALPVVAGFDMHIYIDGVDAGIMPAAAPHAAGLACGIHDVELKWHNTCVPPAAAASPCLSELHKVAVHPDLTAPVAALTAACSNTITVTAPAACGALVYEYSFDGGLTWGTNNVSAALAPGTYDVHVRSVTADADDDVFVAHNFTCNSPLTAVVVPAGIAVNPVAFANFDICEGSAETAIATLPVPTTTPAGAVLNTYWFTDAALITAYNPAAAATHTAINKCAPEVRTLYCAVDIDCDGNGVAENAAPVAAGTVTMTIFPLPQAPIAKQEGCTVHYCPVCPGDALAAANPTGGAVVANFDAATNTYTSIAGELPGTLDLDVTSGLTGSPCAVATFAAYATPGCNVCPAPVSVADAMNDVCDGGLAAEVTTWQANIIAANPLDPAQDPSGNGSIAYSSVLVDGTTVTTPDGILPTGVHGGVDLCSKECQVVYAYMVCDLDGTPANGDETFTVIGKLTINVFPLPQAPIATANGCSTVWMPYCSGDAIVAVNPTGGAVVANFDAATNTYTSIAGELPGTLDLDVTSGLTGSPCAVATFAAYATPGCNVCPAPVSVADAMNDICDGGLAAEVTTWQANIIAANPLDPAQDPSGNGSIAYSSVLVDGTTVTTPDGILPTGVHGGVDLCSKECQVVYAYMVCDLDGTPANGDETFTVIGKLTLNVFPQPQAPIAVNNGCSTVWMPYCSGDVISNAANATGDANTANFVDATDTYSASPEDAVGAIDVDVTSGLVGNPCAVTTFNVATPSCACSILAVGNAISACDPATNTHSLTVVLNHTMAATGSIDVNIDGGVYTATAVAGALGTTIVTVTGIISDGLTHTIDASFIAPSTCAAAQTNYTAPANCTPICNLQVISTCVGPCMAGGNYNVDVAVVYMNEPAGNLILSVDGVAQPPVAIATSPQMMTLSLPSDGANHTITAAFASTPTCNDIVGQTYTSPANCNVCTNPAGTLVTPH